MINLQQPSISPFTAGFAAADEPDPQASLSLGAPLSSPDAIRPIPILPIVPREPQGPPQAGSNWMPASGNLMQQLLSALEQLLQMFGFNFGGQNGAPSGAQYFQSATLSSTGDPHLSFEGTTGSGQSVHGKYDSMTSHADLVDSDSFIGGFQIGTSVTQPGANGVTYNQSASITTQNVVVTMNNTGGVVVNVNGSAQSLSDGQSVDLGYGETVSRAANGAVTVSDSNGLGGSVVTTLAQSGPGINVSVQAQDVDLGGDIVSGPPLLHTD